MWLLVAKLDYTIQHLGQKHLAQAKPTKILP